MSKEHIWWSSTGTVQLHVWLSKAWELKVLARKPVIMILCVNALLCQGNNSYGFQNGALDPSGRIRVGGCPVHTSCMCEASWRCIAALAAKVKQELSIAQIANYSLQICDVKTLTEFAPAGSMNLAWVACHGRAVAPDSSSGVTDQHSKPLWIGSWSRHFVSL